MKPQRRTQGQRKKIKNRTQRRHRQKKYIEVPPVSKSIKPGDDFYSYVNSLWLDKTQMPPSESSFGVSEEIEDNIRNRFLRYIYHLIHETDESNKAKLHDHEKLVMTFFKSGFYSNRHRDHEKTFKKMLSELGCMKTREDIMATMGTLIKQNIPTLLMIYVGRDLKNPDKNVVTLTSGALSLPDSSYYQGSGPGKMSILKSFEIYLYRTGKHLGYEEFGRIASIESQSAQPYDEAVSAPPKMVTGRQLATKYKNIPWKSFWMAYGFEEKEWPSLRIQNRCDVWLEWLDKQLMKILVSDWITWFRVQITLYFAPVIPSPIDDLYFKFFGARLRGDKIKMSQENLLYHMSNYLLQPSLSYMYKKCCLSDSHQKGAQDFVDKIMSSAIKRIDDVTWLSSKSREKTKEKIRKVDLEVAEVDSGDNYKIPLKFLSEIDVVHNMRLLGEAITHRDIYYMRNPDSIIPPGDAVYEVNAHYYISGNRLVIPAGITLWPFYNGTDNGWCFGGLGAVVGHELLHAFDEEGKDYDPKGVFRPWWSVKDLKQFLKKTNALIKLFNNTEFMGRFVNGRATLSENIADLGGLGIALDALKRDMDKQGLSDEKKKEQLRNFFISYAVSWRTKERRQRSIYRLFTDVHAPAALRVNRIVTHFQDFYDIFDVKPGDPLYIDPKDRIVIF